MTRCGVSLAPSRNQLVTFINAFLPKSSPLQVFRILHLAVVRIIGSFLFLCTNRETWAKWPRVFSRYKSRRQVRVQCLTCENDFILDPRANYTACLGNPQKSRRFADLSPIHCSETIRHRWYLYMDLNIGETRVWRLDSGPNLQP